MILSANQPYIFPYLTYYQLIYSSDIFIFGDNLNFSQNKYVFSNVISNKYDNNFVFNVPIEEKSSRKKINELKVHEFINTKNYLFKKLLSVYGRKNVNTDVYDLLNETFNSEYVSIISSNSIINSFKYLNIERDFHFLSDIQGFNEQVPKENRIINLCKKFKCETYINLPGGKSLYDKKYFHSNGIKLEFISSNLISKTSFLDILFRYPKDEIISLLNQYSLT